MLIINFITLTLVSRVSIISLKFVLSIFVKARFENLRSRYLICFELVLFFLFISLNISLIMRIVISKLEIKQVVLLTIVFWLIISLTSIRKVFIFNFYTSCIKIVEAIFSKRFLSISLIFLKYSIYKRLFYFSLNKQLRIFCIESIWA